jgi:hypothetical protein
VFQTGSSGQQVVGDVQHVVGLVVGEMDLQQVKIAVDCLIEFQFPYQQMYGSYFDCVYQVWSCFFSGGKRLRFFQK